jgi:23S rRNA G2069 N7-methylase RlmK/C1962 C5-methylase RlmI
MQDGWGKNTTVVDDPASAEAQDEAASTEKGEENENAAPRPEQEQVAPIDRHVLITENGLRFLATPFSGQKTGFYCDQVHLYIHCTYRVNTRGCTQRENRALVRELCPQGGTVLDLYCYTGAFAVHAAVRLKYFCFHRYCNVTVFGGQYNSMALVQVGGASRVHAVDSSLNAIEVGRENARLNKVEDIVTFEKSDALEYMRRAAQEGLTFDMVVVDPPKLAPTKKSLDRAAPMYTRINALALSLVRRGGLLFTFSCSGSVARGDAGGLLGLVQAAARTVGREVTVLRETGPACCHTLNPCYTEGRYLTALLVGVR